MATGDQFLTALKTAISPKTIVSMRGLPKEMQIKLSDGKTISVSRATVKATAVGAALTAYVTKVLA